MDKGEILKKFSAEPDKYYKVKLFDELDIQEKLVASADDSFGHLMPIETIVLRILRIPIRLLEIPRHQRDLTILSHGRRSNHFLLKMVILQLVGIQ